MTGRFSKAQMIVMFGVVKGSVLCLIGIASSYWRVHKVGTSHSGLWNKCGDIFSKCDTFDMEEVAGYLHVTRGFAIACLFLGCASGITTISLAIGRQDSRPILVSIISFIGGLCGLVAVGIFVGKYEEANNNFKYGWSFGLFCTGASVLTVILIIALCASPNNPIRGYTFNRPSVIVTQAGPNPYHNMSPTTGVIVNQSQTSYSIPHYGLAEPGYSMSVITK